MAWTFLETLNFASGQTPGNTAAEWIDLGAGINSAQLIGENITMGAGENGVQLSTDGVTPVTSGYLQTGFNKTSDNVNTAQSIMRCGYNASSSNNFYCEIHGLGGDSEFVAQWAFGNTTTAVPGMIHTIYASAGVFRYLYWLNGSANNFTAGKLHVFVQ